MSAIPPLNKTYASRVNVPFPDNATALNVVNSQIWLLKALLMDQVTTGTLVGTRHANSVWTCYYSCDGVTAGTPGDGVDRWGSTFNSSKLVHATYTSPHSWFVLHNAHLGLYLLIDLNSSSTPALRLEMANAAYTGGSATGPGPTSTSPWPFGSTSTSTSTAISNWVADTGTGNLNWAHFTTTNDGRFHFSVSRTGLGVFSCFTALWPSINQRVGDNTNWFAITHSSISGRGAPAYTSLVGATGCVARTPNNAAICTQGGLQQVKFGGYDYCSTYGVDSLSGDYLVYASFIMSLLPQVAYRGQLEDIYFIGTAAIGASIPSTSAQERVVVGDIIVPFISTVPTV